MSKKSTKTEIKNQPAELMNKDKISQQVEERYKNILKILSWVMSICFISIIVIANFDFYLIDIIVKILFYLGFASLFIFTILEIFSKTSKRYLFSLKDERD